MNRPALAALLVLALLPLSAPAARAQLGAGILLQYSLEYDEAIIGGELHVPIGGVQGLTFVPSLEVYTVDDTPLVVNGNLHYAPAVSRQSPFRPYLGAGLAIAKSDDETEAGVNVLGGLNFRAHRLTPFVQLKYRAGEFDDRTLGGGIRFIL